MALSDQWKKLQNGSDIRGVAIDGVEGEMVNLTSETVSYISCAFAIWLADRFSKNISELRIAVGTDSRLSGPTLKSAAMSSMSRCQAMVSDCAIASTPAMFMACVLPGLEFDGSIMITASHLPFNRNGLKFFTKDGGLEKNNITSILEIAQLLETSLIIRNKMSEGDLEGNKQIIELVNEIMLNLKINIPLEVLTNIDFAVGNAFESKGMIDINPDNVTNEPSIQCAKENQISELDLISIYAKDITEKIIKGADSTARNTTPLKGLRIIVDAGNGAGGFFVDKVLKPLGADTQGSQFLDPDGNFPNHIPNPEDSIAMKSIQDAVLSNKADFGIIFDTDVDRAGAVDKAGREINRNRIIAVMSAIVLEEHPKSTVVTDSITSSELKLFIEGKLGGIHHRFKRGYKNVINEAIRLNSAGQEAWLAIETSGHGALKENYFMDDGAYLIAKMLVKIANMKEKNLTIDSLVSDLADPVESREFRFKILVPDFKSYGEEVLSGLLEYSNKQEGWQVAPDNYEGIRVSFDNANGNGWFLLRMSLHDPLMPLNIESNNHGGVALIASNLLDYLKNCKHLDLSGINEFMSK